MRTQRSRTSRSRSSSRSTTPRPCPGREGKKKPKTRQLHSLAGGGALGGTFWGLLFGLLFFIPLLGTGGRRGQGALVARCPTSASTTTSSSVRSEIEPGTSALFLMTSDAVEDKVKDAFAGTNPG